MAVWISVFFMCIPLERGKHLSLLKVNLKILFFDIMSVSIS